jgi:hypothetical protein
MGMESYRRQSLFVAEGPDQGASYPLQGTVVTLGRATDNSIVLDSSNISRHHAQIRLSATGATIEDLGSTNGTWVNNQRLFDPQPLMPGDVIRLADYITFRYTVGQQLDGTAKMDPGSQEPRTQVAGQAFDFHQPPARVYEDSNYVEPYVPVPPASPSYPSPLQSPHVPMGGPLPQRVAEPEQPAEEQRPRWVYVLIGLLVLLLCLCVGTAVYIWFAPREFWDWLFNLFSLTL